MGARSLAVLAALATGCASARAGAPPAAGEHADRPKLSPPEIAQHALPSVALIRTPGGLGTGFVVGADGRIATSLHVIIDADEATVLLGDEREFREVRVVAVDESRDLAILRVPANDLPVLELGDSAKVMPGEPVVAIGHPLGLGNTVSNGLVSAVRTVVPGLSLIQISAPISVGSSGGPVLDEHGDVIAISTLVFTQGQNLNFCMPVNDLRPLLEKTGGVPIREFAEEQARHHRLKRPAPHELSIFDDCKEESVAELSRRITEAINLGAPLFNQGNAEACYRVYEGTVLDLERTLGDCRGAKEALLAGVRVAGEELDPARKAWAMRFAFDALLEAMARKKEGALAAESMGGPPRRQVPKHRLELLMDCSNDAVDRFAHAIVEAIEVGAPLFNRGNAEACYRVYEGASLDLIRERAQCPGAAHALEEGLERARALDSPADRAWAMRDAFDGLLEVLAQQMRLARPKGGG